MFMALTRGNKGLASLWLVDALDDVQFLQFLKCAIYRNQPQGAVFLARHIEDFQRGEGMRGFSNGLHNGATRAREAVSVFLELNEPEVCGHDLILFLKLKIIFNKYTDKKTGRQAPAHPAPLVYLCQVTA